MTRDVTALTKSLCSIDSAVRQTAAETLAQLGPDAQGAAVALVEACTVDDDSAREWIVATLEGLGPPRACDVARLAALVQHASLDAAYWAATLLGRLKGEAAPAVGSLAATLAGHPEMTVRQRSAWALGQIGPAASAARAALEEAAAASDPRLASLACEAINQIR